VLTTDQKGAIAETAILHEAIKLGIAVLKPFAEGERYDFVFDLRPRLVRIQCKWAVRAGEVVMVRCYSCRRTRNGMVRRVYTDAEVDAFAAYCAELDRCFSTFRWLSFRIEDSASSLCCSQQSATRDSLG
jgi:PD-(D/E)XK nuclease superfamily protein